MNFNVKGGNIKQICHVCAECQSYPSVFDTVNVLTHTPGTFLNIVNRSPGCIKIFRLFSSCFYARRSQSLVYWLAGKLQGNAVPLTHNLECSTMT